MKLDRYVFDTSAVLSYIEKEPGFENVENLFRQAFKKEIVIYISIVTCIEIYYVTLKNQGYDQAAEQLELIKTLPLTQKPLEFKDIKLIGSIKAGNKLSFADSCIAGLAKTVKGILVHKDPEYEQLENEIRQLKLPYKDKTSIN